MADAENIVDSLGFVLMITSSYLVILFVVSWINHLWWKPRKIVRHFSKQGVRGPRYHFFTGNLKELVNLVMEASSQHLTFADHNILPRVLPFYHQWKRLYGATFLVWFGPTPRVTISDADLIKEIFVMKPDSFEKVESPSIFKMVEGNGLLNLKGEKWAHHRKIITPTLYVENLKLMIPAICKSVEAMLDKWSAMATVDGKVEIEVSKWFQSFTEEVLTRTIFGSSYEDGRMVSSLHGQLMVYAVDSFHKASIPAYRFLPTKKNLTFWRLDKEIRKSLMKLIHGRRESSNIELEVGKSNECPRDLLEQMIKPSSLKDAKCLIMSSDHSTFTHSFSRVINDDDIIEECKGLFFAGKDTTMYLMTWMTILLAMHPHWQTMARNEVLKLCGRHKIPTKNDVPKLKIMSMILYESLRLYPPVVAIIRRAKLDVQLGDLMIPRDMELLIPILAIHHDQGLWGHDATVFNPTRFLQGVAHAVKHPMAFMPFGLGAHRCVGQNLATLQAKLSMAMILQRFSFELAPSYIHAPSVALLLYPQYGALLRFHEL